MSGWTKRKCPGCESSKPVAEFSRSTDAGGRIPYGSLCNSCLSKQTTDEAKVHASRPKVIHPCVPSVSGDTLRDDAIACLQAAAAREADNDARGANSRALMAQAYAMVRLGDLVRGLVRSLGGKG